MKILTSTATLCLGDLNRRWKDFVIAGWPTESKEVSRMERSVGVTGSRFVNGQWYPYGWWATMRIRQLGHPGCFQGANGIKKNYYLLQHFSHRLKRNALTHWSSIHPRSKWTTAFGPSAHLNALLRTRIHSISSFFFCLQFSALSYHVSFRALVKDPVPCQLSWTLIWLIIL